MKPPTRLGLSEGPGQDWRRLAVVEHIMLTAHLTGSAIVIVCPKEAAEYYQERLLSYGLTATIEPE